jgi:hypothetical protein
MLHRSFRIADIRGPAAIFCQAVAAMWDKSTFACGSSYDCLFTDCDVQLSAKMFSQRCDMAEKKDQNRCHKNR